MAMNSTATPAGLAAVRSPRARAVLVGGIVAVFALIIVAFLWGPLSHPSASTKQSATVLLDEGLAAQLAGRPSEAADDYRKALQADPNNYWAYYNLGVIEQQAGRTDNAEHFYRSALALNPDLEPALYNLAIIRSGPSPKEAESLYRHAIAVAPRNAAAHLNLGFLLIQEGNKADGTAELEMAVKLDPQLASRLPPASPTASPKK